MSYDDKKSTCAFVNKARAIRSFLNNLGLKLSEENVQKTLLEGKVVLLTVREQISLKSRPGCGICLIRSVSLNASFPGDRSTSAGGKSV